MSKSCDGKEVLSEIFNDEKKVMEYGTALKLIAQSFEVIDKLGGSNEGVSHLVSGVEILAAELNAVSRLTLNRVAVENMLSKLLGKK